MITDILDTIGKTPLLTLRNFNDSNEAQILLKYERYNPGGSIKDRAAKFIIEQAERNGLLKPGGTIIESSSGNFGISLAMIGAARGYKVIVLVDPKTTSTNVALLKSFGAEVIVVTEKDDCGSYHKTRISLANKLAQKIENAYRPDQCFNLLNSMAHYQSTAQEIINDCAGKVDVFITAVSTGGQLGGISRYLKMINPQVKIIAVDADGSTIFGGEPQSYRIPGIGLGWTPINLSIENIDYVFKVPDEAAFRTARAFAKNEGILMGPSSGACALVALNMAQQLKNDERIVCMVSDGGDRYIQTLFNDEWMTSQGFSLNATISSIRELASHLQPWSVSPNIYGNYKNELINELQIPLTTLHVNEQISSHFLS